MTSRKERTKFSGLPQFWVGLGLGLYDLSPLEENHSYARSLSAIDFGRENAQPQETSRTPHY